MPDLVTSLVLGVVFLFVVQLVREHGVPSRFDAWATGRVNEVRAKGHVLRADFWDAVRRGSINGAAFVFLLVAIVVIGGIVSLAFAPLQAAMVQVVDFYWPQLLGFVTLLVTASSILLGFAFTAETIFATRVNQMSSRLADRAKRVKLLGLGCLGTSFWALGLNATGDIIRGKLLLELSIVLLILEAGYAAILAS